MGRFCTRRALGGRILPAAPVVALYSVADRACEPRLLPFLRGRGGRLPAAASGKDPVPALRVLVASLRHRPTIVRAELRARARRARHRCHTRGGAAGVAGTDPRQCRDTESARQGGARTCAQWQRLITV